MNYHVRRIAVLWTAGFVTYKATVAVFAQKIPGQPFYGFGFRDWLVWLFSPSELAFILGALTFEFAILYFIARRLSLPTLAVWGGGLGAYVATMLFPFDLLTLVDNLPDHYWPPGMVGAVLEVVVFFVIIPMALALTLLTLRRSKRHEVPA